MGKILWVNPSFLDYRIPLYAELNKLCKGNFYLIYSKRRVPQRCTDRVDKELEGNAIGLLKEKIISIGRKSEFANLGVSIPFPKGLYKLIKSVDADVIIAEGFFQFTPWALLYAVLHHKLFLIAYERTAHTERNCPLWRRLYRKFINLFVDGYVVNGALTKEYLISQGVKSNVIFTGAMCADSKELAGKVASLSVVGRLELKKSIFKTIPSGVSFVFVGRMIPRKGVANLLQGWKHHIETFPDDRLLLVGDGPLLEEFKQIQGLKDTVVFAGGIDYSEIYKYYAASDVFVIPTLEDNWSLVVPEAMACGLPIACSIYNGCYPELVHVGENGVVFDPMDENSVLKALSYFHLVDIKAQGRRSIEIESDYNPAKTALNIFYAVETLASSCKSMK